MVPILREKFSFVWIEYLFCFGEMSFFLCKFRNSGNSGKFRSLYWEHVCELDCKIVLPDYVIICVMYQGIW